MNQEKMNTDIDFELRKLESHFIATLDKYSKEVYYDISLLVRGKEYYEYLCSDGYIVHLLKETIDNSAIGVSIDVHAFTNKSWTSNDGSMWTIVISDDTRKHITYGFQRHYATRAFGMEIVRDSSYYEEKYMEIELINSNLKFLKDKYLSYAKYITIKDFIDRTSVLSSRIENEFKLMNVKKNKMLPNI